MVNRCPSKFSNKTVPKSENSYKIQNAMLNQIKCVFHDLHENQWLSEIYYVHILRLPQQEQSKYR